MKLFSLSIICLSFLLLPLTASAFAVHDAISNMTATIKTALDKVYQAAKLELDAEKIGISTEQLTKAKESLKQLQDTYERLSKVHEQITFLSNNIGDPMKIAAYVNRNFTKNKDIDNLLTISDRCMNASPGDLDFFFARNILDEADQIVGGDYHLTEAKIRIEHQKREKAIKDIADQITVDVQSKYKDLVKGSQELVPNKSTLNEIAYATYKTSEYQAGVLSQFVVAQQQQNTLLAERMKKEDEDKTKLVDQRAKDVVAEEQARKNLVKEFNKQGTSTKQVAELFNLSKCRAF